MTIGAYTIHDYSHSSPHKATTIYYNHGEKKMNLKKISSITISSVKNKDI